MCFDCPLVFFPGLQIRLCGASLMKNLWRTLKTLLSVTHTCALSSHCRCCDICNLDSHDCHHMSILNNTYSDTCPIRLYHWSSRTSLRLPRMSPWQHGFRNFETGGQRLTMSETTLNVQGSSGTEGEYGQVRENLLGQRGD